MGTTADESKQSMLSDPLLPPSPPSIGDFPSSADPSDNAEPISYVHSPRPLRDLTALLLFLLLSISTFALGIFSVAHHNPNPRSPSSYSFDPRSSSCTLLASNPNSFLKLRLSSSSFEEELIGALVATAVLAGPAALVLLSLLRRFAKQLVYAALPFFILLPSFLNVYWFVACALSTTCSRNFPLPYRILVLIFVFLIIGVFLWIILANWHRIDLTIRIIRIAALALAENLALVAVLPGLLLGLVVYFVPVVVFLVFATWNGRVLPLETRSEAGEYYVCAWKEEGWVPLYFALAIVTMIWTVATMVEAQVYVVAGTVAQWYFARDGIKPRKSLRSSLR